MADSLRDRISAATDNQYRIDAEIGRGGMSVVYRAHDLRLNRSVAIKVLPPELALDPAVRTRFTREAQTSAQLSHPNIVPIYDVGEHDGIAYFVMALVTGGTLASHLELRPLRAVEEVRRTLAEVADALAYAHLRGVIHRDIKADNILLESEGGRSMVTDFGIARAMESGARLTQTGIAVGTPTYMSPEQAVGEHHVDGRSDIYSLGVLGYQMLTGRVPFTASNSMALLLKHVSEPPRPILELRPEAPRALADAIERALAKTPDSRWPTASAFREALLSGESYSAWRSEPREPVRYVSPIPRAARRDPQASATPAAGGRADPLPGETHGAPANQVVMEPPHLATLTLQQRADLLLWNGRVNLMDRVKFVRRYALFTGAMCVAGFFGFAWGIAEELPPMVLSPLVPLYMMLKLRRRGKSLRGSGLQLRRVFLSLRAKSAIPTRETNGTERRLEKLASKAILAGKFGSVIRRAAADRVAINELMSGMSKVDRELLPEIKPTIDALFERVVGLAESVRRMETDIDPALLAELNARIDALPDEGNSPDEQRRITLLSRQRDSLVELAQRRTTMVRQLESAGLALGNLRYDLMKLRSSGLESALGDVSSATQEARALSKEIGLALAVAAEVRDL